MVGVIWFIWFATCFFLFIILCNFMISYISQTYEDVLEMQTEDTYERRCELNYEFYSVFKFFKETLIYWKGAEGKRKEKEDYIFNCFLLTANFDKIDVDSGSTEHTGFTKKIKTNLDEHKLIMKNQIKVLKKEIDEFVELSGRNTEKKMQEYIDNSVYNVIQEVKRVG